MIVCPPVAAGVLLLLLMRCISIRRFLHEDTYSTAQPPTRSDGSVDGDVCMTVEFRDDVNTYEARFQVS